MLDLEGRKIILLASAIVLMSNYANANSDAFAHVDRFGSSAASAAANNNHFGRPFGQFSGSSFGHSSSFNRRMGSSSSFGHRHGNTFGGHSGGGFGHGFGGHMGGAGGHFDGFSSHNHGVGHSRHMNNVHASSGMHGGVHGGGVAHLDNRHRQQHGSGSGGHKSKLIKLGGAAGVIGGGALVGKLLHDRKKAKSAQLDHDESMSYGGLGLPVSGRTRLLSKVKGKLNGVGLSEPVQGAINREQMSLASSKEDYRHAHKEAPKVRVSKLSRSKVVTPELVHHGDRISTHSANIEKLKSLRGVKLF